MSDASPRGGDEGFAARFIYILYLAGLIVGVTMLIGLVMAYVYRAGAPAWLASHYRFQIRTFWIGLLYSVIGLATSFIFIGFLVLLFVLVWLIVRCVRGLKHLSAGEPYPTVEAWLW